MGAHLRTYFVLNVYRMTAELCVPGFFTKKRVVHFRHLPSDVIGYQDSKRRFLSSARVATED